MVRHITVGVRAAVLPPNLTTLSLRYADLNDLKSSTIHLHYNLYAHIKKKTKTPIHNDNSAIDVQVSPIVLGGPWNEKFSEAHGHQRVARAIITDIHNNRTKVRSSYLKVSKELYVKDCWSLSESPCTHWWVCSPGTKNSAVARMSWTHHTIHNFVTTKIERSAAY